jgi:hypothetical protein
MANKTSKIKIPGEMDIKGLIEDGEASGRKFLEDKLKEFETEENKNSQAETMDHENSKTKGINSMEAKGGQILTESQTITFKNSSSAESTQVSPFNLTERQKGKEFQKFSYESYFAYYQPSNTEKRESTHIYSTNLEVLKKVCLMERSKVISLINNIVSAWIDIHIDDIRDSFKHNTQL